MFSTKLDVDRHVNKTLAKVKTEKDRNFRAYSIARLYFDVGDYESCVKYLGMYLNVKDDNPAAHNLLGQSYHKLNMVDRALAEYKASLALDPNQNNVILKVCELLTYSDIPMDVGSARYWAEKAAAVFPDHPTVYALKASIISAQGADGPATLALLKDETNARPNDPVPYARLLRHLIQTSTVKESFDYAFETYFSDRFNHSPLWNDAVVEVLAQCGASRFGWQYWILKLTVLERLTEISLIEGRGLSDATASLWKFDRALNEASQTIATLSPNRVLAAEALSHFGGQLCLHAATLLLKKAGQELGGWREAVRAAAPLFLLALQPIMPLKSPPVPAPVSPLASSERLLYTWYKEGAYRRSQAGHTIRNCFKDRKNVFIDKITQYCSGTHWRDKLYRKLFTSREHLEKMNASYLLNAYDLAEVSICLPKTEDLQLPDKIAGTLRPESLHNQIWLAMNAENLADVSSFGMDELRLSVNNLSNCGAETLNKLDIDTFLYCAVLTVKQNSDNESKTGYWDPERPNILPAILTPQLCTPVQNKWWMAMWKIGGAGKGDIGDVRVTLTRGIETVRCVGNHGLDPELLIEVARIFAKRSKLTNCANSQKFLEARANTLYSAGVPLLERIRNNISIRTLDKRLFEYTHGELSSDKLDTLIEEGKLYLAEGCINNNDDDKAVEILETIKSPYASFHLYTIFKKIADSVMPEKLRGDPENKGRYTSNMTKAKEYLYITMDRLKANHAGPEHPLYIDLGDHINSVEQALGKIEILSNSRHGDSLAYSSDDDSNNLSIRKPAKNNSLAFTPRAGLARHRNEVQPSPESLEAQIRQLQKMSTFVPAFMDQVRELVDSNKTLVDEVKDMKKAYEIKSRNIEDTIQDQFKNLKVSVDEAMKTKIEEFKNERNNDVTELKKEINHLKIELGKLKNTAAERQQQLDENELLMLEEEAGAYFPRQTAAPPQLAMPSQHYPHLPPNALYSLYAQYPSVPQLFPGSLFPDQSLYSDLLAPRTVPQTVPIVPPAIMSGAPTAASITQPLVPPTITTPSGPILPTPVSLPEQVPQPVIHNYHIPLPQKTSTFQNVTPVKPVAGVQPEISTPVNKPLQSLQSDTSTPKTFSLFDTSKVGNTTDPKPFSFLNSTGAADVSQNKSGMDKSRTLSERSTDSYDPIPDFKPIIELPEEVPVTTGEENEEELFVGRAKLFRFVDKEWKERGLGIMKILRNATTAKVRILMRRERVLTICANHIITPDIEITPMKGKDKEYFWGANDFADNEVQYEKFCIRFKTNEIGKEFYDKFRAAIEDSKLNSSFENKNESVAPISQSAAPKTTTKEKSASDKHTVGGLTFTSAPVIKMSESATTQANKTAEPAKVNPFAGFSFNKTTSLTSTTSVGNVFSLPKISEAAKPDVAKAAGDLKSTDKNIIYESTAKIATVSANVANFLDKGSAVIRVIKDKEAKLMAISEASGEVWYDHSITKTNKFEPVLQPNTLSWKNPEGVTYRATFSNAGIFKKFQDIVTECAASAPDVPNENENKAPTTLSGWGDKFKPVPGSWNCMSCYINNKASDVCCVACNTPKDASMPKKDDNILSNTPATKYIFGIPPSAEKKDSVPTVNAQPAVTPMSGWGDKFKPVAGSWNCQSCYINNKATDNYCVACNTPRDPSILKKEETSIFASDAPMKFTFGIPSTNGGAPKTTMPAASIAPTVTTVVSAPTFASTNFMFGMPQDKSALTPNKTVSFGDTTATNNAASPFPQKNTFQFTLKTKSPVKDKDALHNKSQDSENEYVSEDEGEHIVFAPIIPLPNKVDVKTGEEDEEILYFHKAKLYRFADGEWKECGVGDIKILKHKHTNKLRVLMRREPINKICLNHILNNDIKYTIKDDRSWLFFANDFSKEELTLTNFCVRFKTKEIAQDFLDAVNKARADLDNSVGSTSGKLITDDKGKKSDEEVVFVSETKATEEEKEKARKLMLPESFYNYQHKEPCKGCVGCDPDKYVFAKSTEAKTVDQKEVKKEDTKSFIFGQKITNPLTTTACFAPVTGSNVSIFGGTPNTANAGGVKTEPKFVQPSIPTPQPAAPIFGSNMFGAKTELPKTQENQQPTFNFNSAPLTNTAFGSNQNSLFKAPITTTGTNAPNQSLLYSQAVKTQESSPGFGSAGSVFGKAFGTPDAKSIFAQGNATFGQTDNKPQENTIFSQSNAPIFGQTGAKPIFGGAVEQKSFGSLVKGIDNPENGEMKPVKPQTPILGGGIAEDLSFSALAAKTKDTPLAGGDNTKPFTWAGAGAPIFGSQKPKDVNTSGDKNKTATGDGKNDEGGADGEESYDPHYEPIIPMPDEIKVVTGEEDEVLIYSHRAKLFRFTTEWKERGIGDIKLLFHPERKTYRLLLRQSQVHKTVLNQRVTKETQMLPLAKSDRALMWAGINYTEDNPEGTPEKLAVRFSDADTTAEFKSKIETVLKELESLNNSTEECKELASDVIPTTVNQREFTGQANVSVQDNGAKEGGQKTEEEDDEEEDDNTEEEEDYQGDYYDYEDQGEYYGEDYEGQDDDEDLAVVFDSEGTVDDTSVQITLYAGQHGGHLRVYHEDEMLSDTFVVDGAVMQCDGAICRWKGIDDDDDWKTATLPDEEMATALHASFQDLQ